MPKYYCNKIDPNLTQKTQNLLLLLLVESDYYSALKGYVS